MLKIIVGGIALGWGASLLIYNVFVSRPGGETSIEWTGVAVAYGLMAALAFFGWRLMRTGIAEHQARVVARVQAQGRGGKTRPSRRAAKPRAGTRKGKTRPSGKSSTRRRR